MRQEEAQQSQGGDICTGRPREGRVLGVAMGSAGNEARLDQGTDPEVWGRLTRVRVERKTTPWDQSPGGTQEPSQREQKGSGKSRVPIDHKLRGPTPMLAQPGGCQRSSFSWVGRREQRLQERTRFSPIKRKTRSWFCFLI